MKKFNLKLGVYLLIILSLGLYSCSDSIDNEEFIEEVPNIINNQSKLVASSSDGHHYVGNLKNVLGDVKQAQITNRLKTNSEVNNLLDGFEEMGVNGIRIAIFADGVNPNETMYNYLFNRAKARGFKIFANPAQGGGGRRIANGTLGGALSPVKGDVAARNRLITRIKNFAQQYKCDWINAFNEDGRPGSVWNISQINTIYSQLEGNLNGADLIGSCDWGLPAGILSLQQTNIKNHISVASSHNLGFNHDLWSKYISEAGNLPVWDSEVNDNKKFANKETRLDAALAAGVDGLVLYNSWNGINLSTGNLSSGNQAMKDKYTQYYVIRNKQSGDNIKPFRDNKQGTLMVQAPSSWNGTFAQWEVIPTDNGFVRFRNRGSRLYFRPTNNNDFSNIYTVNSFSGTALHVQWKINNINNGYSYVINRASGKKMRSRNGNDLGSNGNESEVRINQVPDSWTGDATQWEFIKAN